MRPTSPANPAYNPPKSLDLTQPPPFGLQGVALRRGLDYQRGHGPGAGAKKDAPGKVAGERRVGGTVFF